MGNFMFIGPGPPRSSTTHVPGSGLISTDALSPKIANFIKFANTDTHLYVFFMYLLELEYFISDSNYGTDVGC